MSRNFVLLLAALALASCSSSRTDERPVARVYERYLYPSDLEKIVPPEVKGTDSVQLMRSYIDNWVRQAVILKKAERNVSASELNLEQQVEDYRNSLVIYHYEQALVNQRLDTLVSEEELRAYYEENKQNFLLTRDIYRIAYAALGAGAPGMEQVQGKMLSPSPEELDELNKYCLLHASSFSLADSSWYDLEQLSAFLPVDSIGPDRIAPGRVFEIKDKNTVFLIAFRELRRKDSISPFGMERQTIRNLILHRRRMELLAEMEKQVMNEALQRNEFEIYDNE